MRDAQLVSVRTAGLPETHSLCPSCPRMLPPCLKRFPGWGLHYVAFGPHTHHHGTAPGEGSYRRTSQSGGACLKPLQGGVAHNIPSPGQGSTVEPPEVVAFAAEPPEVSVVSPCELSSCPSRLRRPLLNLVLSCHG